MYEKAVWIFRVGGGLDLTQSPSYPGDSLPSKGLTAGIPKL